MHCFRQQDRHAELQHSMILTFLAAGSSAQLHSSSTRQAVRWGGASSISSTSNSNCPDAHCTANHTHCAYIVFELHLLWVLCFSKNLCRSCALSPPTTWCPHKHCKSNQMYNAQHAFRLVAPKATSTALMSTAKHSDAQCLDCDCCAHLLVSDQAAFATLSSSTRAEPRPSFPPVTPSALTKTAKQPHVQSTILTCCMLLSYQPVTKLLLLFRNIL